MDWIGQGWMEWKSLNACLLQSTVVWRSLLDLFLNLSQGQRKCWCSSCCCCCCCCTKFDLMFWMLCLIFLRDKVESCLQCDAKLWGATEESYLLTLKNWQSTLCPVAEECCRSNVIGCDWVALQCQQLGASLEVQNRTVQIVKIHLAGGSICSLERHSAYGRATANIMKVKQAHS